MSQAHNDLFENQFSVRTYIPVPWGEVETVDVIPPILTSSTPIFFAPGFRETPELQKDCIKILFDAGYRVITCFHPVAIPKENTSKYNAIEFQKANNILAVINAKNIANVNIITHSEGALNTSIAAHLKPQLVEQLILLTPAGLNGKDNLISLGWRFFIFLLKTNSLSVVRNVTRKGRKQTNLMLNFRCGIAEGNAMITSSISGYLKDIRKQGVKVFIIPGESDNVFPKEKMKKMATEDTYDDFIIKMGGHEVYTIPDISMDVVIEILKRDRNVIPVPQPAL